MENNVYQVGYGQKLSLSRGIYQCSKRKNNYEEDC